jgi:hypothetical protein
MRDRAVEVAAKSFLERQMKGFGEVTRLELDSQEKVIAAEVTLVGEACPVSVRVGRYEIRRRDGESFLVVDDFSASREWIGAAFRQHVAGREFKIPNAVAAMVG